MFRLQISFERIDIFQQKFLLLDSLHAHKDIQQPVFGFDIRGLDELGLAPFLREYNYRQR